MTDDAATVRNDLGEHFNPDRPNAVWCTNITYLWTDGVSQAASLAEKF